jgi:hypothetical protein
MSRPTLFIGSSTEGLPVARALRNHLKGVDARLWTDGVFGLGRGILERLVEVAQSFEFAALVISPADLTSARNRKDGSPRDNVFFELGLFMGSLGRLRTFVVRPPKAVKLRLPSDLGGIVVAELRDHPVPRTATFPVARLIKQAIADAPPRLETESALSTRERKERESAVDSTRRSTIAKRILTGDLDQAASILERDVLGQGKWPPSKEMQWWQSWLTFREELVMPLDEDAYRTVTLGFDYVRNLQDGLRAPSREFNDTDREFLENARDAIAAARAVLAG